MLRMRGCFMLAVCLFSIFGASAWITQAEADHFKVGVSIENGRHRRFDLSVGDFYGVPLREVVFMRERGIDEDEMPVVFFIARRAKVHPMAVVDLRVRRYSWMDISLRYGLRPENFYFHVTTTYMAGPYSHAYRHFRSNPRKKWRSIRLDDRDIVNLVNLRYMSQRYRRPPEDIMRMRAAGRKFASIHDYVHRNRLSRDRIEKAAYRNERVRWKK